MTDRSDGPVSFIFDSMAGEYDDLRDLWYAWLFSRLHYFLVREIERLWSSRQQRVIDVGCGTGFQSFLYAALGCDVVGVDIAGELITKAREKVPDFLNSTDLALFPAHYPFVRKYDEIISRRLRHRFPEARRRAPEFQVGSALSLDFPDASFSHVNCCGSVLSLVDDSKKALDEIARVLKPGGTFFIEAESRWNCDAFWPLIDRFFGGTLGYDCTWKEAIIPLRPPWKENVKVEFPFGEANDPVYMDLCLFTRNRLKDMLRKRALVPKRWRSIHNVTNLLPSTILDTAEPSWLVRVAFGLLRRIEASLSFPIPGCSIVVSGRKT